MLEFWLNGQQVQAPKAAADRTLLAFLRDVQGLTSAKDGCSGEGTCGCCAVLVDGKVALACRRSVESVDDRQVVTVEGLKPLEQEILRDSFVKNGAVQCGFCTPGIVVRAHALLHKYAQSKKALGREDIRRALSGHTCRCTGYQRIVDAIIQAGTDILDAPSVDVRTNEVIIAEGARLIDRTGAETMLGEAGPAAASGVGGSLSNYRAGEKVLGRKDFLADVKAPPRLLHGAVVFSPVPRCRVVAVNKSAALAVDGVVAVLTAADVPGERHIGLLSKDWPLFVAPGEETRCVGDVLALVVGESADIARRASQEIVIEHEKLAPLTSPAAALADGAHKLHPGGNLLETCAFRRGDVEKALKSSDVVIEETFVTQRIEHAFLEPEAAIAAPAGDGVKVLSQGQGVHDDRRQIASILGVDEAVVDVELVSNGGAFGGKEDLSIQGQTALAAFLLGRPVKTVLSREESLLLHPKRHPLTLAYTVGADRSGKLLGARVRIVGDTGAYASVGTKVMERAAGHSMGPYQVDSVDVEAKTVYTNNPPCGAMRGFGANQAAFAIEGVLDRIAARVGIDGLKIRRINLLTPGDRFATGQRMGQSAKGLSRCLDAVARSYQHARFAGIACGIKNTGIGNGQADIGRVLLSVTDTARIQAFTGFTEMGQGLFTIIQQVVAEETGLDPSLIDVSTRSLPEVECGMTTASRATALSTKAAKRAAVKLNEALRGNAPLEQLAGQNFHGEFICDITTAPDADTDEPVTHMAFSFAAQVVVLNDDGRLERVIAAHDVGRAINPVQCSGQIEGGVHMGLGYALSEDFPCVDAKPVVSKLGDLGIIKAKDTPTIDVIIIEEPDEVGGYGSKGVGEIGLVPTAGAVAGALNSYDGKWRTTLPMTDSEAAKGLRSPGARKAAVSVVRGRVGE